MENPENSSQTIGRNRAVFDLAYLLSCAVNESQPDPERVSAMDFDAVYGLADKHMLGAAAAMALESAGFRDKRSTRIIAVSLQKTVLFDQAKKAVLGALEDAGIWYMPLKGAVIKDLYPKSGMREMADLDILFDASRAAEVRTIMEALGFSTYKYGQSTHDVYRKKPVLYFEMHKALFGMG
ncbi:MAG: nucleotidyltransferase family protein [Anaerolineaceae bacterium]|nr:nucleotidyltransferase family protein [Anaerolineaceae bacterium]